jgi:FHA domain
MMYRLRGLWIILVVLSFLPQPVRAQNALKASLAEINTKNFPQIEAYLQVQDGQGRFYPGLKPSDLQLIEDQTTLSLDGLDVLRPGVQFTLAVSPGPAFAVRNSKGTSRYDYIVQALSQWASHRQGSSVDDLSLLTTGGTEFMHAADPVQWHQALISATLGTQQAVPNLDTLFRAVEMAADPLPRAGMGHAVLFITPPLEAQAALSLENLTARAVELGVHIFTWVVTPPGAPTSKGMQNLIDLAAATGGQYANITGEEDIPDLETYLEPLRSIYRIRYTTQIKTGGTHQISVSIQTPDGTVTSPPLAFDLTIQPPDPAFISPELEIVRKPPNAGHFAADLTVVPLNQYVPQKQELQILIDFPDGRRRALNRTALYVDGQLVEEHTSPPFDRFTWDLTPYTQSGLHTLRAEAQDNLGLTGKTMDTDITVQLDIPAPNIWRSLAGHLPVLAGLALLVVVALSLLVMILGGRLQPYAGRLPARLRRARKIAAEPAPPVIEPAARRLSQWVNRLQRPQPRSIQAADAFLTRIQEGEEHDSTPPVPLPSDREFTLGCDPEQATLLLDDPSVEALHACLKKLDGAFMVQDLGSVAGTWVNYEPVAQDGTLLHHADLIYFGRVGFRFTLRQPGVQPKPKVINLRRRKEPLR